MKTAQAKRPVAFVRRSRLRLDRLKFNSLKHSLSSQPVRPELSARASLGFVQADMRLEVVSWPTL